MEVWELIHENRWLWTCSVHSITSLELSVKRSEPPLPPHCYLVRHSPQRLFEWPSTSNGFAHCEEPLFCSIWLRVRGDGLEGIDLKGGTISKLLTHSHNDSHNVFGVDNTTEWEWEIEVDQDRVQRWTLVLAVLYLWVLGLPT